MKTLVGITLLACLGCTQPGTKTTEATSVTDTSSNQREWGFDVDFYLDRDPIDSSAFQIINQTCAIMVEETPAQAMERMAAREAEWKEREARNEKARLEWESQPHDSSETFEPEMSEYQSDGDFYMMQAQDLLTEMKIPLVATQPKPYVRLAGLKNWTIDIRTNLQPNWTFILFRPDREPVIVEAMDITKERLAEFFGNE